jgi:hypothetical protein
MPLAQDQKAMLQLLLERGQSYDDIASLLGGSREDVRRRARAALEELGGQDPDRDVALTDYILGQADPIGRADAVRHLQADPDSLALAEELANKLRLIAPQAELPDLPQPKRRRAAAAPTDGAPATEAAADEPTAGRRSPLADLSPRQSRLFAAIGASALILLFVILAIAGVFGGDDEDGTTTTASGPDTPSEEITTVTLRPPEGGSAGGEARFGIANETQPFVEFQLEGLQPPPEDQTYVVWFLLNDTRGYPLAPLQGVTEEGTFEQRFPIPQAALPVAVRTQSVDVSLVDNRQLAGDIQDALQGQEVLLDYSGESVLRGRIPRLEAPPGDASDLEVPGAGAGGEGTEGAAPGP